MIILRYGNTNTFYINGLLVDTDYAGTLHAFYKVLKENDIKLKDIHYVLATHYHPDHMGIIGELVKLGVNLVLVNIQVNSIHFSDGIFERDKLPFVSINEMQATIISCESSRNFLAKLGIAGTIIHTPSHSADSISVAMDNGDCIVGDLEPFDYIGAYKDNMQLRKDWEHILQFRPKRVLYAHMPAKIL